MRRLALPLIALVLVAAVLGVQVAAGGGRYVPLHPDNACAPRQLAPIAAELDPLAADIVLLGLDNAACRLGISRERLVLELAGRRSLDPPVLAALRTGLVDAVGRLQRDGRLPKMSRLLPAVIAQSSLPAILKTIVGAIPASVVDTLLPTGPLLRRTIHRLDLNRVLHELNDPAQLRSVLQSTILQAAVQQILNRLHP